MLAFSQNDIGDTAEPGDGFGHALAAADFNGDGYSDVAVGSPFEDLKSGVRDAGVVHVVYGGESGLSLSTAVRVTPRDVGAGAPEPGTQMGWSLSNGDFDGNGNVDLVVGVPGRAIEVVPGAGQLVVRYNGSADDGPGTHVGRSFPAYVIVGYAEVGNPEGPQSQGRLCAVLP